MQVYHISSTRLLGLFRIFFLFVTMLGCWIKQNRRQEIACHY